MVFGACLIVASFISLIKGALIISLVNKECLDAHMGHNIAVLWGCHKGPNQQWSYNPKTNQIKNFATQKCLHADLAKNLLTFVPCQFTKLQQFDYNSQTLQLKLRANGQCLDNDLRNKRAVMWHCHGGNNQKWEIDYDWDGRLRSLGNGRCLDAFLYDPNGKVGLWDCHTGHNQIWSYNEETKQIRNVANGKCLDAHMSRGLAIFWDCHPGDNQKWFYDYKTQEIKLILDGRCLDNHMGAHIPVLWGCHGGNNQKWQIEYRELAPPKPKPAVTPKPTKKPTKKPTNKPPPPPQTPDIRTGQIRSFRSRECLDAVGPGTKVILTSCNTNPTQQWRYNEEKKTFVSVSNGKCLDLDRAQHLIAITYPCNGGLTQEWPYMEKEGRKIKSGVDNKKCLTSHPSKKIGILSACKPVDPYQIWELISGSSAQKNYINNEINTMEEELISLKNNNNYLNNEIYYIAFGLIIVVLVSVSIAVCTGYINCHKKSGYKNFNVINNNSS